MYALQATNTKQHRTHRDAKAVLRAHVDQLSSNKQREFVALALELIADRHHAETLDEFEIKNDYHQLLNGEIYAGMN